MKLMYVVAGCIHAHWHYSYSTGGGTSEPLGLVVQRITKGLGLITMILA
jgi:hypothetical protein